MFKKTKILVIGDIVLDKYSHGTVNRISPETPVPVDIKTIYKPGSASNVAKIFGIGSTGDADRYYWR